MYPNLKGSETLSLLATIDPASQAAGTVTTAWVSAAPASSSTWRTLTPNGYS